MDNLGLMPHCYHLISSESGQTKLRCHACGAAVIGEGALTGDQSPFPDE